MALSQILLLVYPALYSFVKLLFEEKVAVVPGDVFGPGGDGHIRCSYAASVASLNEALKRMELFLSRYRPLGHSSL